MHFEWNPKKAVANRRKHGVTFEEASSALRDTFSATAHDSDHSEDEERFVTLISANAASTYDSMVTGGTDCTIPEDTAGYWTQALYKNGVKINPSVTQIYYRKAVSGSVKAFPANFRMIAGNGHATSPATNPEFGGAIYWGCSDNSTGKLLAPPNCSTGQISLHVGFPSCWDGVHIDSMDHKSHVAYPSGGGCPSTHPVALLRVIERWEFTVGKDSSGITLSSGPVFTAHGDFWNTWHQVKLEQLVTDCLNANKNCGSF